MSDLRIYAETGACLLNTGPDVGHETDAIRQSMKEEVLLYYAPSESFLRCYVQVQRAQPEQFAFEYDHDVAAETDIFGAFVRDARAEVGKTNWRIIDENSVVFTALESEPYAEPGTDEDDVRALLGEGEPIEFAATDRTTAVGLVPYLRETFGEEHSIAISRAGRVRPVTDADFVIVPDQSYTGLTGATKERLERVRVEYWQGQLNATVDELSDGAEGTVRTDRLIAHVRREGLDDRFGIVARPASSSWLDPGGRWFVATAVAGTVLVTAYLLATTVRAEVLGLLGREVTFPPSGVPLPAVVSDALSSTLPSWAIIAVSVVLLAAGGASVLSAVGLPVPKGALPFSSSDGQRGREQPSSTGRPLTAPERSIGECLDRLADAADRTTAVESLSNALAERGVDVLPEREASLYSIGIRALGVGAGVAVSAAVFVGGGPVLERLVSLLSNGWIVVLSVVAGLALLVVVAGVGVGVRAALGDPRTDDRPTGTPGSAGTRSDVSRRTVEQLREMTSNPESLKREIEPRRLLRELQKNPRRDDIAKLLREYEQLAGKVVPPEKRHLIESSSGPGGRRRSSTDRSSSSTDRPGSATDRSSSSTDRPGSATDRSNSSTDRPGSPTDRPGSSTDRPGDGPARTDDPSGRSREGPDHGDGPDGSLGSTADTPAGGPSAPEDLGLGRDDDTSEGGTERGGGVDDNPVGGASTADGSGDFTEFRYDGANSGYVRRRDGPEARPTAKWEYRTDYEPLAPVVSGGTVYIVDRRGRVYAVDETGEEQWTTTVDDSIKSSPIVHDDTLYFGSDSGTLYAMDTSGDQLWNERIGAPSGTLSRGTAAIITPPAVTDGTVYVGDVEGDVHARDAATGREVWRDETDGGIYGKLAVDDGRLFAANEKGLLAAYDTDGGRIWSAGAGHEVTTTPAVGDGSWYVVDGNGVIHRHDPTQSGAEVGTHPTGSTNPVSPTVGDEKVFVGTKTGTVIAVGTDLETRRWKTETDHEDRILAPFILDERNLYVPAGRHMYAFDPSTGAQSWSFQLKNRVRVQPAYGGGSLFVATKAGHVRALDLD